MTEHENKKLNIDPGFTLRPRVIVITGPTATGKSGCAVRLAKEIGGEIISADSMQVYRGMDIGSAKITKEEMQGVPHHLIDVMDPDEDYNVHRFQEMAKKAIADITARGKIPVICGGTGFYIQALLYDIDFTDEPETEELADYRRSLESVAAESNGASRLHKMLSETDPESAEMIDEGNVKRVIRALMFYHIHGQKISEHNSRESEKRLNGAEHSPYNYTYFVLYGDRERLYRKIDQRVDLMMEEGLAKEAERLYYGVSADGSELQPAGKDTVPLPGAKQTAHLSLTASQGIGYKEMYAWLRGETDLDEAVNLIKRNTRRFAKRQLTWFRRERDVIWINIDEGDPLDEIRKHLPDVWRG